MLFDEQYKTLLEYFVDNAKPYYLTKDGTIKDVHTTHTRQIISDYNLQKLIFNRYEEENNYPMQSYDDDWIFVQTVVDEVANQEHLIFLVVDLDKRILYARCSPRYPYQKQRNAMINYCIDKGMELKYDMNALA